MDLRCSGALRTCRITRYRWRTVAFASRAGKGFGTAQKHTAESASGDAKLKAASKGDKKVVQDAAAIAGGRPRYRPVRPEEAARGKLDYVQVADWGDGDRSKLGELRLVSHVPQYEGGGAGGGSAGATDGAAPGRAGGQPGAGTGGPEARPFHMQLAQQLRLAESRGALAVVGPPPPPLAEWSFREGRYVQYLADCLEVHAALEDALREATAAVAAPATATAPPPPAGPASEAPGQASAAAAHASASAQPAPQTATVPPPQCALRALAHLAPGRLGLERSGALRADLGALRGTAGYLAAEAAEEAMAQGSEPAHGAAASGGGGARAAAGTVGAAKAARRGKDVVYDCTAGPMARSYAQVLRRLGRVAGGGESAGERQEAALRLVAHASVLHMSGQAAAVRCGAAATERLALLQRRAAATYHEYPEGIRDPRVVLSTALDAAGAHLAGPAARQVVFDELPGAMQKTGLLMSALAHRD